MFSSQSRAKMKATIFQTPNQFRKRLRVECQMQTANLCFVAKVGSAVRSPQLAQRPELV